MKKTLLFQVVFFMSFLFVSCDNNISKYSPDEYIKILKDDKKAIKCSVDSGFHINNIPKKLPHTYVAYIMNASCSYCIYTFIKFYKQKEILCDVPVCLVIDKNYSKQVEFYLEKSNIKIDFKNIYILENNDNKIINGNIDNMDLNGHIYLIDKGQIKEHICYFNNI